LGFTDSKTYAPGIEDSVHFDRKAAVDAQDFDNRPILKMDIFGHPLYTLWKWIAESEWIGDFAKDNPDLTLINCTEGGLGFPGVVNRPFSEVCDECLAREYPIIERLHGEIQNSHLTQATPAKIFNLTHELQQSLKKCVEYLTVLIEEAQAHLLKMKESKTSTVQQSGYAALCEIELADEPGYKYIIEMFNAVKTKLLEHEIAKGKFISEYDYTLKKTEVNMKRLTFLKEAALANRALMDLALETLKKNNPKKKRLPQFDVDALVSAKDTFEIFDLIYLPAKPKEGMALPDGCRVRMIKDYGQKKPRECRLEKDGFLEGQCLLYYPNGKVKAEMFYKKGALHGPVTFFSPRNKILSKSLFVEGKRQGISYLYYANGSLYAHLESHEGRLHGIQHYFYPNGSLKSRLHYHKGIQSKAELF
jgi:hypothetical protein